MLDDLSDRGLRERFGDVLLELPELFEALRRFEIERRPHVGTGGVQMRGDGISMKRRGRGTDFGIRIRNPGSEK